MAAKRKTPPFDLDRLRSMAFFDAVAAAHFAPIAKRTFYAAIAARKLPGFRMGGNGKLIVRREDLEAFLTGTPAGEAGP
jgi:hypothetical protein